MYHSNKLEGSKLSVFQNQNIIQHHSIKGEASVIDSLMAIDHYRALNQALSFGANRYPLSEKMVLQLQETRLKAHLRLTRFTKIGKLKDNCPEPIK